MITIIPTEDLPQGSNEWKSLRAQYISATDAYDLLQNKPIREILKSKATNSFAGNYYTKRGHDLEPEARDIYSAVFSPVSEVGFVINDKFPHVGCSPDGLVGEDGLIEIKCFNEKRHFDVYKNLDAHIIAQIQYQLWVTERAWNTLCLYNPEIKDPSLAFLTLTFKPDKKTQERFEEIFSKEVKNELAR